jgi:hypothetical protein
MGHWLQTNGLALLEALAMSSKTIVMIYDQDDGKRGEISVMESPQKAARLVETLLEAGFERERIRVFTGAEMGMQITHRPVVALLDGDESTDQSETVEETHAEPEPESVLEETLQQVKSELQEVAVAAAPFTNKDGIRFSSAFRPA